MKTCTIPRSYRQLLKRCAQKYFPGEEKALLSKADLIYDGFRKETPSIGGRKNLLASNLDMAMTFFAFYEATDRCITKDMFLEVTGWMTEKLGFLKKLFDFNKPWMAKLMYRIYIPYAKKANENKQNGKWNNTWGVVINPEGYTEGCSFHLVGCPLVDFAKKHGYMDFMPHLCELDHAMAALMNARLLRNHTVSSGADSCDYWYVGSRSNASKEEPHHD